MVVNNTTATTVLFPASSSAGQQFIIINRNPSGSLQFRNSTDTANQNYNTPSGISSTLAAASIVQLQLIGGVWYQIGN